MYSEKKQALAAELSLKRPAVLAVSGAHNSGKTTLLEKLIPLLRARGLKVGVIKHDGHDFTPDVPGTDSFRLREAGAEGVAVFSGSRSNSICTLVSGSGWHRGISSLVRLVAMMPATRATPSTSPFFTVPLSTAAKASAFMVMMPWAVASRAVTGFSLTSTITALPAA